jgi:hypothetical protein
MKTIPFLLLLSFLFLQGSCTREDDRCPTYKLPPATQTGANTIGCKVNGQVCIPRIGGLFSPITKRLCFNEETRKLRLIFDFISQDNDFNCGIPRMYVMVNVDNVHIIGEVEVENMYAAVDIRPNLQVSTMYSYRSFFPDLTASLEITKLDKTNRIISGTFSFEEYEVLSINGDEYVFGEKAYVTDGRFDFTYNEDGSCVEGYSN